MSYKACTDIKQKTQTRSVQMTRSLIKYNNSSDLSQYNNILSGRSNVLANHNDLNSLHTSFIKELYRDRNAPVKPFNRDLILASCTNCLDKNKTSDFFLFFFQKKNKKWGSKSGIYIIEYKYDPLIYYIGRSLIFKRRFYNHFKADSSTKLHVFLKLVGWLRRTF